MMGESGHSQRIGTVLAGQFRVERLLGEGGMGSAYLAEQLGVGRKVVVKLMKADLPESQRATLEDRFQREARLVAQLDHPNLVHLHTFGRCETGELYLAMEYVAGRTLRQVLQAEGPLPEARVLGIVEQICGALHEAHVMGVIHRDLKPDNVMLTQRRERADFVKVLDFGIAKLLSPQGTVPEKALTATGAVFGTPQYMAPEQVLARAVDARTDVYALGLITYELLTGAAVFEADSAIEVMMTHTSAPVPPPSERRLGLRLRRGTEALIACALEKEPARRFADMLEMAAVVRAALRDAEPERPVTTPPAPPPREDPYPWVPAVGRTEPPVGGRTDPPVAGTIAPPVSAWGWLTKNVHPSHVVSWALFCVMAGWGIYSSWSATHAIQKPSTVPTTKPYTIPPQTPQTPADAGMETLRDKYDGYVSACLNYNTSNFSRRKSYLESVPKADGPAPGKKANLQETMEPAYCERTLAGLAQKGPELALDRSARRLAAAARALYELTVPAHRYYDQGDYQEDATARGRAWHRPLLAAFDEHTAAYAGLRRDLEYAEAQLRAHYAERATPEQAAQLEGDAAARAIVRLGNVNWQELKSIDLTALRRAIRAYERVLDQQTEQERNNVEFLGQAKQFARRVEQPSWTANERRWLKSGSHVEGSPQELVSKYGWAVAFFKKLPLPDEVFFDDLPPEMRQ